METIQRSNLPMRCNKVFATCEYNYRHYCTAQDFICEFQEEELNGKNDAKTKKKSNNS